MVEGRTAEGWRGGAPRAGGGERAGRSGVPGAAHRTFHHRRGDAARPTSLDRFALGVPLCANSVNNTIVKRLDNIPAARNLDC